MEIKFISQIFIIIFLLLISGCSKKTENISNEKVITSVEMKRLSGFGVVNVDRLRLRADNDLHTKTLRYLDKGEIVSIIKKDNERVRIDEMEDYWFEIEYNGISGWIFGHYIDLYTDYENAETGSKRYMKSLPDTGKSSTYYVESISYNLFYISNGKIFQITNGLSPEPALIKTEEGYQVISYFFTNKSKKLYYIASRNNHTDGNNNLFSYDFIESKNKLLLKSVSTAYFDPDKNQIITAVIQKKMIGEYWTISIYDTIRNEVVKEVIKLKKAKDETIKKADYFSKTLRREFGSLCYLEWDNKNKVIYFKPPEENQTYLISISDGNFIKIDIEKSNIFNIDSSRYIEMNSIVNEKGITLYTIVLKDKISGIEKEITSSQSYPINFSLSPRQNYIAITMASMDNIVNDCFSTSIYLLSLNNYSLSPITNDNRSYQPKWSYFSLK